MGFEGTHHQLDMMILQVFRGSFLRQVEEVKEAPETSGEDETKRGRLWCGVLKRFETWKNPRRLGMKSHVVEINHSRVVHDSLIGN